MSTKRGLGLGLLMAGCWSSQGKVDPVVPAGDVSVEIAAVTLAQDCGDGGSMPPPVQTANAAKPAQEPLIAAPSAAAPARCAGSDCGGHCEQTSMQLALRSSASQPSAVSVKKVELLDSEGAVIGELTPRLPSRWAESGAYERWDQQLPPSQAMTASYLLSAPNWAKVPGGRWEAHNKRFQLRVTLLVDSKERSVEKKAIAPAMLEPAVPT